MILITILFWWCAIWIYYNQHQNILTVSILFHNSLKHLCKTLQREWVVRVLVNVRSQSMGIWFVHYVNSLSSSVALQSDSVTRMTWQTKNKHNVTFWEMLRRRTLRKCGIWALQNARCSFVRRNRWTKHSCGELHCVDIRISFIRGYDKRFSVNRDKNIQGVKWVLIETF